MMILSRLTIAGLLLFFLPGLSFSQLARADDAQLAVDFTNTESRSISVRLGSEDGIDSDMNFAVLDSTGLLIAEFYPREILADRFWSGPLRPADFARIRPGSPVIRIVMDQERAERLREQFTERTAELQEERRGRRLQLLDEEKYDLEEQLNELEVDLYRLGIELKSLREDLDREKRSVKRQNRDLRDQLDDLRSDRSELAEDRNDLLDRRDDLLRRSDPPQDRIRSLNEDISDLDRDIGRINIEMEDLREEIRELQGDERSIQEEIEIVQDEQRELDSEVRELERELEKVLMEIDNLKAVDLDDSQN